MSNNDSRLLLVAISHGNITSISNTLVLSTCLPSKQLQTIVKNLLDAMIYNNGCR